jgi:hypothetical protein
VAYVDVDGNGWTISDIGRMMRERDEATMTIQTQIHLLEPQPAEKLERKRRYEPFWVAFTILGFMALWILLWAMSVFAAVFYLHLRS